jgi:hypothetical protein
MAQTSICEDCGAEILGTGRTHCDACIMAMEANWDEVTLTELIAEFGKPLVHWHKCVGCGRRFDCECPNGDYSQPIECMECLQADVEYYYDSLKPLHRITTKVRKPNIPEWNR